MFKIISSPSRTTFVCEPNVCYMCTVDTNQFKTDRYWWLSTGVHESGKGGLFTINRREIDGKTETYFYLTEGGNVRSNVLFTCEIQQKPVWTIGKDESDSYQKAREEKHKDMIKHKNDKNAKNDKNDKNDHKTRHRNNTNKSCNAYPSKSDTDEESDMEIDETGLRKRIRK